MLYEWLAENLGHEEPFLVGYATATSRFFLERSEEDPEGLDAPSRARLEAYQAKAFHALPLRSLLLRSPDLDALARELEQSAATHLVFSLWGPRPMPRRADPLEHARKLLGQCRQLRQVCPFWREAIDWFLAELPVAGLVVARRRDYLLLAFELPRER